MAGREYIFNLYRLASRRMVVVALVAVLLAGAAMMNWRNQAAEREVSAAMSSTVPVANTTTSLLSLNGRTFEQSDGLQGAVMGEFEGYFDGKTGSFTLTPRGSKSTNGKDNRLFSRSDPSGEVGQGVGFTPKVVRSAFVNDGNNPPTVTGEFPLVS